MNTKTNIIYLIIFIIHEFTDSQICAADFNKLGKLEQIKRDNWNLPFGDEIEFPDNSIFFIETAARGLNYRESCSVISAARANPNRSINVLFTEPFPSMELRRKPLIAVLNYTNVSFYRINIKTYCRGTPLEDIMNYALLQSPYRLQHTSDILRYLTLYKFGGIYLDLDVIVAKSFDTLPQTKNWVGRDAVDNAASSLISIATDSKIGELVITSILSILSNEYDPTSWSYNSDGVLNKALHLICNVNYLPDNCKGFKIYDMQYFHPIQFSDYEDYFSNTGFKHNNSLDIYAYHVWNNVTGYLKIHENSLYADLAINFCPEYTRKKHRMKKPQNVGGSPVLAHLYQMNTLLF